MKPIVFAVFKSALARLRHRLAAKMAAIAYGVLRWADTPLPFGLRTLIGVLFIGGGVLWFLPILGIWMVPLGAVLIALDIPWTRRQVRPRVHHWMDVLKAKAEHVAPAQHVKQ